MKKSKTYLIAAFLGAGLMLAGATSWAQSYGRLGFSTLFNPQTVGTLSGEIVRVDHDFFGSGADYCTQAVLRTSEGDIPKDRVTVTGSLVSVINKPFLLVMEMEGDRLMKLREADGRPLWATTGTFTRQEKPSSLPLLSTKPKGKFHE
ncbi:MAG: hypothetical protein ACUVXF_01320 [Desulfobaccales bacterium]